MNMPSERFSETALAYAETMAPSLRPVAAEVVRRAALGPHEDVLDIGTGTGIAAAAARGGGRRITGIDAAPGMLAIARDEVDGVAFEEMDFMALRGADAAFDVVLAAHSLLFAADRVGALREWLRVTRPGGRLSLSVPGPNEASPTAIYADVYQRFGIGTDRGYPTREEVAGYAATAGWTDVAAARGPRRGHPTSGRRGVSDVARDRLAGRCDRPLHAGGARRAHRRDACRHAAGAGRYPSHPVRGHLPHRPEAVRMSFADLLRIVPGTTPDLAAIDPGSTPGLEAGKPEARDRLKTLRDELTEFQRRLWAESRQSLLVILQALDAGGKDGLIRNVIGAFNPQGVRVTGFGVPSEDELRHDYLWRIHAAAPGRGRIGVFNRSQYEDVLVVRVNELVPASVWNQRYEQINAFEAHLAANGTRIVKLFLHISRDEQRRRFEKRLEKPDKHWKWSSGDLDARAKWDDFQAAYTDALAHCSTDVAPWYVVPADHKWYRDLAAAEILAQAAGEMDPQWPAPEEDLSAVVVPE